MSTKLHQILVRLFFVLLFITGFSAAYYFWPTEQQKINNEQFPLQADQPLTETNDNENTASGQRFLAAPTNSGLARNDTGATSANALGYGANTQSQQENLQSTTYNLQAGDEQYSLPLPADKEYTVYELMQFLTADSKKPFSFSAKDYPGMGYFIEEINGVKNNPQTGEYWIYYINGQSATVGASQYVLKPNDIITWKYEKAKF